VRFITFETLGTGVRAFECALSMRTSSFVHGLMTRRAVFAFTARPAVIRLTQQIGPTRHGVCPRSQQSCRRFNLHGVSMS
jgi:hypothetical protein